MEGILRHIDGLRVRVGVTAGYLRDLVVAGNHATYLNRHRTDAIVLRVRLVSAAFSGLTLLWIALDALTLPWPGWALLAVLRVAAAAVFTVLAAWPLKPKSLNGALGLLAAMLVNPLVFFVASQFLFSHDLQTPGALLNARLYEALPFVIMAGLGVFPLVAVEGVVFALPVLAVCTLAPVMAGNGDWIRLLSTLWILVLILGIYLLAGMIQLHYMMALLRRASHDPLTGAFSRRSGMELIELQFRMAVERDAPFAVAFVDVDNFKSINDGFGHDVGDRVLRGVADSLTRSLRRGDSVIRWGGEEFVVLLLDADMDGLTIAVNRVLHNWLGLRPDGAAVTASIGVAERRSDGCDDWPDLVDLADRRMYQAKTAGKAHAVLPGDQRLRPPAPGAVPVAVIASAPA
ncbi:MAG: diguanylate cyclase [Actinomycetota bacterium]